MPSPPKAELSRSRGALSAGLPWFALLSQVLVAFTIEFDNESERQMPHRTTQRGSTTGSLHAPLAGVTGDVVEPHAVRGRSGTTRP